MTDAHSGRVAGIRRGISRRQLLAGGMSAGGALAVGGMLSRRADADTGGAADYHLRTLSADAAALYGAMADRVFPSDSESPGATELGFIPFLDGQLSGSWGAGEGLYRHGPFHEATTSGMGYQLPLVPRDLFKHVATAIDNHVQSANGKPFHELSESQQDAVMTSLEDGKVDLGFGNGANSYTSAVFFAEFLSVVNQALFADPMYGGNRNVGGWKWVGFPGNPMAYGDAYWTIFPHQDDPYEVQPKGLMSMNGNQLPPTSPEAFS